MRLVVTLCVAVALLTAPGAAFAAPEGQMTWAVHVTIAPTWFDPAETAGIVTPFMLMYAMHDALLKPMPGNALAPSLAESWSQSKDGLTYEFIVRKNAKFHDGSPVTADDVKFSFERYRGTAAGVLKAKVARIEIVDPHRVRFVLKLVLEANEGYWRKAPSLKTLVFRVIPDESTRLAALKRGEVDVAYSITGALAEELARTPGLTLAPTHFTFTVWITFLDQWDAKSPWHDKRVRLAANHAIDRGAINQAAYLGKSTLAFNFVPSGMQYFWTPKPYEYDPKNAKQLLAEAGYPNGFDAGDYTAEMIYGAAIGEPANGYLQAIGIRTRLRLLERAAFFKEYGDKKLKNVVQSGSGAPGNAATRIEQYTVTGGRYTYGTYPEIDGLFSEQANESNPRVRQQLLHKIQQLLHERAMFAPMIEPAFLNGVGSKVAFHGLGAVPNFPYASPYEDLKLTTTK